MIIFKLTHFQIVELITFATMISIPHKTNQFLVFIIKFLIVIGAFYFIYNQLTHNETLNWNKFITLIQEKATFSGIVFLVFLSFINRFLEILKWQNLVSTLQPISLGEATKQVLGGLTAGIVTPNGIGEYAGKALYFHKNQTKQVVFLNLICNGIQMILSFIFGIIGLWVLGYRLWVLGIIGVTILFFVIVFILKNFKIKGYSIDKLIKKTNEIPKKTLQKNNFLGLCRYLVFSHQTYFLFVAFNVTLPYFTLMACITSVYLLSSILPSFQVFDFAVKGSIAVFFFNKLGVNDWIVVFITTVMWFLNVVIPVVLGSYYVLKFRYLPNKTV